MYDGEITEDILLMNLVICILKWLIWKTRNYIKYNKSMKGIINTTKFIMYPIIAVIS
jgi:hypothetical protein